MLPHTALTLLVLAGTVAALPFPEPAKLRRIPRIYNALITTDEELLPSQAYPAVAPVLRPAIAHYPLQPYHESLVDVSDALQQSLFWLFKVVNNHPQPELTVNRSEDVQLNAFETSAQATITIRPYPEDQVSAYELDRGSLSHNNSYGLYAPDPYSPQAYNLLPGFNDTLRDPEAPPQRQAAPVFSLQAQQIAPQITDQVKNNRPGNPDIPDVPPPPLPVSPPRDRDDKGPERKPQDYPPAPPQGLPF